MRRKVYSQFWKNIGKTDPYFGVLTHEEYRSENLDDNSKQAFFASGERHINRVAKVFNEMFPKQVFQPVNALDFGCGIGRLSLALAGHCQQVMGVDVSPAMLVEAQANQVSRGINNVRFQLVSENSGFLSEQYDYIHSSMVFQHIHPNDGMEILNHLLFHLSSGGKAFLQITYHTNASVKKKWKRYLRINYPGFANLLFRDQDYAFPMFDYDLNAVFDCFQRHDIKQVRTGFGSSGAHRFIRCYLKKK